MANDTQVSLVKISIIDLESLKFKNSLYHHLILNFPNFLFESSMQIEPIEPMWTIADMYNVHCTSIAMYSLSITQILQTKINLGKI